MTERVSRLRPASRAICRFSLIASVRSRIALKRLSNTVPVVLHFIPVPAAADTKQKATVRHLSDRGGELRRLDRVALLHQGQK